VILGWYEPRKRPQNPTPVPASTQAATNGSRHPPRFVSRPPSLGPGTIRGTPTAAKSIRRDALLPSAGARRGDCSASTVIPRARKEIVHRSEPTPIARDTFPYKQRGNLPKKGRNRLSRKRRSNKSRGTRVTSPKGNFELVNVGGTSHALTVLRPFGVELRHPWRSSPWPQKFAP
jgi:hypothetical protein